MIFLGHTKEHESEKEKWYIRLYQNQRFHFLQDILRKMKRQATEWEKIFAKHKSDRELVFRIYKELLLTQKLKDR